jgi:hypothetical protein
MSPDEIAALAISCCIGLIWFDEFWKFGHRCGRWLGKQLEHLMLGERPW